MTLAKTDAAGGPGLLREVLDFSSSLALDRRLLLEDLVGSMAHVVMLGRQGIIPRGDAAIVRDGLDSIWRRAEVGTLALPSEEDVHMAVEVELNRTVGPPAALLHSARSRNDQVATDLRLHVRESCARAIEALGALVLELVARARAEGGLILPAYTHRQRAQPVSLGYWLASYGTALVRDAEAFAFALTQADVLPLGVGAISGTSLPIDRELTRRLLGFARVSTNGLDTVGDRDFALDVLYATARFFGHASRLATDVIDFTTSEFGFATLADDISCGSSMMPQKKNPDVFELLRGRGGRAVGHLVSLLTTVKGLPGGYNRDLQEDRAPLLESGVMLHEALAILRLALPRVRFDAARCRAAVADGYTQATDLAEALVKKGVPFRRAYMLVGTLVRRCQDRGLALSAVPVEFAAAVDPSIDAEALMVLVPERAVEQKRSAGGTSSESVAQQLETLEGAAQALLTRARAVPRLHALHLALSEASL